VPSLPPAVFPVVFHGLEVKSGCMSAARAQQVKYIFFMHFPAQGNESPVQSAPYENALRMFFQYR
jgi:hypothetical protein